MRPGHLIVVCVLALLSLGVVMVHSAGLSVGDGRAISLGAFLLSKPTMYMALAILALGVGSVTPIRGMLESPRVSRGPAWLLIAAFCLCVLVYVPALAREVNGAKRWVGVSVPGLGMLSFQPSETAKWASVAFVGWFGVWRGEGIRRLVGGLGLGLAPIAAIAGLILLEDLGTAVLIGAVAGLVLLAAGVRWAYVIALAPVGLGVVAVGILAEPYRMRRLAAFVDPYADPAGSGYHAIQSMAAVAGGDVFGRGLGFGIRKFGYVPEDQTDFIFAIIAEELGFAGAGLIVALLLTLLWAGWAVAVREESRAMRLFAFGVVATIGVQATINLAAVTGLGPTKGIALPLVSSGGTGWILTAAALGVLVGMDRRRALEECALESPAGES